MPSQLPKNLPRIPFVEVYLVTAIAFLFDLVNWIPIINWATELMTVLGFGFYFWIRGLKAWANIAGRLIEVGIESWPLVSVLPGTTLGVVTTFAAIFVLRKLATSALAQTGAKVAFGAAGAAAAEGAKALAGKEGGEGERGEMEEGEESST